MYERFAQLLEERGLTSYKVSKDTGISQSILSAWKNGVSTPKMDKMQILAMYFGVSVDYILGNETADSCHVCGYTFDPSDPAQQEKHEIYHKRYLDAFEVYGEHFVSHSMLPKYSVSEKDGLYTEYLPNHIRDSYLEGYLSTLFTKYLISKDIPLDEDFDKFARRTIPEIDHDQRITPEKYRDHVFQKYEVEPNTKEMESTSGRAYYFDDDTAEAAQKMYENPELRALFDAADGVPKNVLVSVYNLLMSMKQHERGDSD